MPKCVQLGVEVMCVVGFVELTESASGVGWSSTAHGSRACALTICSLARQLGVKVRSVGVLGVFAWGCSRS